MKMLMIVECPHEPFNTLVRNGTAGEVIGKILAAIKPEATYFTELHGRRTARDRQFGKRLANTDVGRAVVPQFPCRLPHPSSNDPGGFAMGRLAGFGEEMGDRFALISTCT